MRAVSSNAERTKICEYALIVSSSKETNSYIEKKLRNSGITLLFANTKEQALDCITSTAVSYVLVDASLPDIECHEFIRSARVQFAEQSIPIILLASQHEDLQLSSFLSSGYDDVLFEPFTPLAISARLSSIEKIRELNHLYKCSVNEQLLAKKILTDAIDEISIKFEDINLLSISKNIFSGDIFVTARHPDGSLNILLADFTGHGLSAALCALPVANAFSVMTQKGFNVANIIDNINRKLHRLLPMNMFMACIFVNLSTDLKHVKVWNGGMPDLYIRSNLSGKIRHTISSSHLPLGITETPLHQLDPVTFEITPGDQLILLTDGLTEALNLHDDMFGEHRVEQCLLNCNDEKAIFMSVVNAFNNFCGDVDPVDDVTLACIPCTIDLVDVKKTDFSSEFKITENHNNAWRWYLELGGTSLCEINPVPLAISEIHKKYGRSDSADELSTIMSLLYESLTNQCCSIDHVGDVGAGQSNISNIIDLSGINIKITMKEVHHNRMPALLVQMVDSGRNFSEARCIETLSRSNINSTSLYNEKQSLIYQLNTFSNKEGAGNKLEAIISSHDQLGH